MLETIWFVLWGVLWIVYFITDGYDLGLGMLMPFLSKEDWERRAVFNAQGPFWDANEVWLITAGGATFAAFPTTYAVMFSALYTPLLLLLFALIFRGVSFEMRSKESSPLWRKTWDSAMTGGSFVAALLLGVAFANIFKGLPLDATGILHGNLLTLLNPYGLLGGVLFVLMFCVHGSIWLTIMAKGEMRERGAKMAARLWPVLVAAAVIFLIATFFATDLYANIARWPFLAIFPLLAVAGLFGARIFLAKRDWWKTFASSAVFIGCAAAFGVAGLFPRLLPSSLDPAFSLTAFNSASSHLTLSLMLGVVLVFIPIVLAYQVWVHKEFSNKIDVETFTKTGA